MKKILLPIAIATLTLVSTASAQFTLDSVIVESRSGGKNFAAYSEDGVGFPNAWSNSSAKSSAEGTTAGIGSRFNSSAGIGGAITWFQVAPTLTAGMAYDVYVTVTSASGELTGVTSTITTTGGTGLPATTSAFNGTGNTWNFVGTLQLDPGVSTPTIRFDETANGNRFYADAVMFTPVPEPSAIALGLIGAASAILFIRRRK